MWIWLYHSKTKSNLGTQEPNSSSSQFQMTSPSSWSLNKCQPHTLKSCLKPTSQIAKSALPSVQLHLLQATFQQHWTMPTWCLQYLLAFSQEGLETLGNLCSSLKKSTATCGPSTSSRIHLLNWCPELLSFGSTSACPPSYKKNFAKNKFAQHRYLCSDWRLKDCEGWKFLPVEELILQSNFLLCSWWRGQLFLHWHLYGCYGWPVRWNVTSFWVCSLY